MAVFVEFVVSEFGAKIVAVPQPSEGEVKQEHCHLVRLDRMDFTHKGCFGRILTFCESDTHKVLVCGLCKARFVFPNTIRTIGELKDFLEYKGQK
ncbi:MAG: hypothetical protein WCO10_03330 [bacterium]